MSWAEIKKAVNSDLTTPLNTLIENKFKEYMLTDSYQPVSMNATQTNAISRLSMSSDGSKILANSSYWKRLSATSWSRVNNVGNGSHTNTTAFILGKGGTVAIPVSVSGANGGSTSFYKLSSDTWTATNVTISVLTSLNAMSTVYLCISDDDLGISGTGPYSNYWGRMGANRASTSVDFTQLSGGATSSGSSYANLYNGSSLTTKPVFFSNTSDYTAYSGLAAGCNYRASASGDLVGGVLAAYSYSGLEASGSGSRVLANQIWGAGRRHGTKDAVMVMSNGIYFCVAPYTVTKLADVPFSINPAWVTDVTCAVDANGNLNVLLVYSGGALVARYLYGNAIIQLVPIAGAIANAVYGEMSADCKTICLASSTAQTGSLGIYTLAPQSVSKLSLI
jgi:hypothetical protein